MATLNIDFTQVQKLIEQLKSSEKEELFRYLSRQTLETRLKKFIDLKSSTPLSYDDITKEVEAVRSSRYNESSN